EHFDGRSDMRIDVDDAVALPHARVLAFSLLSDNLSISSWGVVYHRDLVAAFEGALTDRVFEADLEAIRVGEAADERQRSPEDDALEVGGAGAQHCLQEVLHRKERCERTVLVQPPRAVDGDPGAQPELVPVSLDISIAPYDRADNFRTHGFGGRDVDR